ALAALLEEPLDVALDEPAPPARAQVGVVAERRAQHHRYHESRAPRADRVREQGRGRDQGAEPAPLSRAIQVAHLVHQRGVLVPAQIIGSAHRTLPFTSPRLRPPCIGAYSSGSSAGRRRGFTLADRGEGAGPQSARMPHEGQLSPMRRGPDVLAICSRPGRWDPFMRNLRPRSQGIVSTWIPALLAAACAVATRTAGAKPILFSATPRGPAEWRDERDVAPWI